MTIAAAKVLAAGVLHVGAYLQVMLCCRLPRLESAGCLLKYVRGAMNNCTLDPPSEESHLSTNIESYSSVPSGLQTSGACLFQPRSSYFQDRRRRVVQVVS